MVQGAYIYNILDCAGVPYITTYYGMVSLLECDVVSSLLVVVLPLLLDITLSFQMG